MTNTERSEVIATLGTMTGERVRISIVPVALDLEWRVVIGKRRYRGSRFDPTLMAALTDIANEHTPASA